jgi:hypothetical protein
MPAIASIGILLVLLAVSSEALGDDCVPLQEGSNNTTSTKQPLLTENQCEAEKNRELRVPLLEIPQDDEDPISLSLGAKFSGAVIRLKIPFSL